MQLKYKGFISRKEAGFSLLQVKNLRNLVTFVRILSLLLKTKSDTMKTISLFLTAIVVVLVYSCSSDNDNLGNENNSTTNTAFKEEEAYERAVVDIDLNDSLLEVGSLYYTKEDGSSYEVGAYLDKDQKIVKMIETFVDNKTGHYGKNTFYFKKGKKLVSNEHFEEKIGGKSKFVERISYYSTNGNVIKTKKRVADYEEDIDKSLFINCEKSNCSTKDAQDALNQEGKFVTTFQGFVVNGRDTYLTVGENTKDGFISALMIQFADDSNIKKLQSAEMAMIGKKLTVNFQKMTDQSGFQFQVLTGIKIID